MAGTILYLASRAGGYAHGQEIVIDGGFTDVNPSRAWVQKYMRRQTWMLPAYISKSEEEEYDVNSKIHAWMGFGTKLMSFCWYSVWTLWGVRDHWCSKSIKLPKLWQAVRYQMLFSPLYNDEFTSRRMHQPQCREKYPVPRTQSLRNPSLTLKFKTHRTIWQSFIAIIERIACNLNSHRIQAPQTKGSALAPCTTQNTSKMKSQNHSNLQLA